MSTSSGSIRGGVTTISNTTSSTKSVKNLLDELIPGSAPPSLSVMSERQIVDQMKRQTQTYQRIATLEELMRRAHNDGQAQQSTKEFISKGGVQVL